MPVGVQKCFWSQLWLFLFLFFFSFFNHTWKRVFNKQGFQVQLIICYTNFTAKQYKRTFTPASLQILLIQLTIWSSWGHGICSELLHKWEVGTASVKIYLCLLKSTSYKTKYNKARNYAYCCVLVVVHMLAHFQPNFMHYFPIHISSGPN